ncbi:glycosyl transferase [Marivirga tractuosa]|uniref:Glycosyl transferase family 2 n=1 Tax=Marivirga tractuosa (strain ATCC 23168 / DSM 4126 / NBRC 15989 / NCIMB 1408 / VKM B-1430 / H-43) TaxID=643867 RepID=E4TVV3_MARTH|nr:glycosyltransferase family A protein [Marivirga tractuosa]ADR22201.1 glycosyl transferase family 2 [Marivirga tractuosa DSM 4126]BDD13333.1 glycosyl transferase [Marivirga tractuosa]
MLISVLMPAYNTEKYLAEAINSILDQTHQNWELLICDDASTDKTYHIANSFEDSRITVFKNEVNLKKPKTTNWLFKQSKGQIITIHDADDLSSCDRFEKIIDKFKKDKSIYACGHEIQRISEKGKHLNLYRRKSVQFEEIQELMAHDNTDGDPSLFIKREVIENLGEIYRPYFQNNMDYDLALRIIENYKTTNITEVLSYYRNVPDSISKEVKSYKKLITQDITKFLASERKEIGLDALQRQDWSLIKAKEEEFSKPYVKDKTLHLRKMASFFMYVKMNRTAIDYMLIAIRKEPFKFENWRTIQYCLRKSIFKI